MLKFFLFWGFDVNGKKNDGEKVRISTKARFLLRFLPRFANALNGEREKKKNTRTTTTAGDGRGSDKCKERGKKGNDASAEKIKSRQRRWEICFCFFKKFLNEKKRKSGEVKEKSSDVQDKKKRKDCCFFVCLFVLEKGTKFNFHYFSLSLFHDVRVLYIFFIREIRRRRKRLHRAVSAERCTAESKKEKDKRGGGGGAVSAQWQNQMKRLHRKKEREVEMNK